MNWFYKHFKFAFVPRGVILDIGSGSNPFWRANILLERFLEDDSQRPGKLIVDRPIVCGDIHDIPFVDNAFRFVHCSNILEHIDDPEKAIIELMRISKSGYIETPSEIHEYLDLNFPFHRWAVSTEDDKLIFREKAQDVPIHPLVEALRNKKNNTWKYIHKHHDHINFISWFWHDEIKFRIEKSDHPIKEYSTEGTPISASAYAVNHRKSKLKLMLGKLLAPTINIFDILACPLCKTSVSQEKEELICYKCKKKFPIINKVPMMTKEYASDIINN